MHPIRKLASLAAFALLAACAAPEIRVPPPESDDVARLAQTLASLGPEVDPEEAERAAAIAYEYSRDQAIRYNVTDPPLIHNTKVNMGLRPRGLCYQWADDLEARLARENFQTLVMHRAIANSDTLRIDHSTVIMSQAGEGMFEGVVLDGWREGGRLFWSPTLEDERYVWVARTDVFAERRAQEAAEVARGRN
jgi:hypothetical protein